MRMALDEARQADFPFGAALAMLALVTLTGFLALTRRSGALENL